MFVQVLILEFFTGYQSYEGKALASSLLFVDPPVWEEKEHRGEWRLPDRPQEPVSRCGPGRRGGRSHGVLQVLVRPVPPSTGRDHSLPSVNFAVRI